jgi:CubicO group peptidase (beta-lactamase class C family)
MQVFGKVDSRFEAVRAAFEDNFARRGELGAAVAVLVDGRTVVNLWGGVADRASGRPWDAETLAPVFSCTKAATALCAHVLVSRGRLDLDAPVARYWPEFAAAGKERIPVRMLLNHQAGLPAISAALPAEALYQWPRMTAALAAQVPYWEPGTAHGYHAMTFGWLVGEVVRRVTGKSLGTFFREAVAEPLGIDFWIGLPDHLEQRVARAHMAPLQAGITPLTRAILERNSIVSKAFMNPAGLMTPVQINTRAFHAAELPAANGIATARALAEMYAPLAGGGAWRDVDLVSADVLKALSTVESEGHDRILLLPTRFASGFMKTMDNRPEDSVIMGPNAEAFGHAGAGGSIGMADPVARVAIGYVMNQLGAGTLLNARGQSLIDAVYDSLS